MRIAHNSMTKLGRGTQATLSLTQQGATRWEFDFCSQLVFAQIAIVRVHVVAADGFPKARHVTRACSCSCSCSLSLSPPLLLIFSLPSSRPRRGRLMAAR